MSFPRRIHTPALAALLSEPRERLFFLARGSAPPPAPDEPATEAPPAPSDPEEVHRG
ncbi:MAG: hypothetical protein MUF64_31055 [Polyangiaceae bacterium]|nr:hypothetical protein [Polyangiaceae bacterium]